MSPFLSVGISRMFDDRAKQPLGWRFMKTRPPPSPAGHMISLTQIRESLMSEIRNVVRRLIAAQYETASFAPLPRPDGCRQGCPSNKLDSQAALCCLFTTLQRWVSVRWLVFVRQSFQRVKPRAHDRARENRVKTLQGVRIIRVGSAN